MVIDEDLEQVLNPNHLLRLQLKVLVLLALELLSMGSVVDHGLNDFERNVTYVLHCDRLIVVLTTLHGGEGSLR